MSSNIILNHDFSNELDSWNPNCCRAYVDSTKQPPFAVVTDRKDTWQGLEQDITSMLSPNVTFSLSASVGVSSDEISHVIATLKLESSDFTDYRCISRAHVSNGKWATLEGSFYLPFIPKRVVFYLEGPPPGVDLWIRSVTIAPCKNDEDNLILNPNFTDGVSNWSGRGCKVTLISQGNTQFACATDRTNPWNGIQQELTGRVNRKLKYNVSASVRINNGTSEIRATLWIQTSNDREEYLLVAKGQANDKEWKSLEGKFLINGFPKRAIIYLEGPLRGTDIYVNSVTVKHASPSPPVDPPLIVNPSLGVNILQNIDLIDGIKPWFPLGDCTMSVISGAPKILPRIASESIGEFKSLSGKCLMVKNRSQKWMGPGQVITGNIKLFLTYQVSAWVKIDNKTTGRQKVNASLDVDGSWVNGGQIEISDDRWHEIAGSFRIEKLPSKVTAYIQGPDPGVDFLVAGYLIFAVDRQARFEILKQRTDKIRKRDVTLKLANGGGSFVRVKQIKNSFPFGCCINRGNIDNEDFVEFFSKNFNWSVFGNELKWYWTESQRGRLNYKDADEMVEFCERNGVQMRGHCIFWEVDDAVQQWVKSLNSDELRAAVEERIRGLLTRYKGKFKHYDVNNEMLHGSFYASRLGGDVRGWMFKRAYELDADAALFVNDYHVEDGLDARSTPAKYVSQVMGLVGEGARVGGVGVQAHVEAPVGAVMCSGLDELAEVGVAIWLTEFDVASENEYVRGDDMEVVMREAFAHPAVEGVVLWGIWEMYARENGHLVDAEGRVNEAGRRYLKLREEWMTCHDGHVDADGEIKFRGFHGTYEVEILSGDEREVKVFEVSVGTSPLVVSIL